MVNDIFGIVFVLIKYLSSISSVNFDLSSSVFENSFIIIFFLNLHIN